MVVIPKYRTGNAAPPPRSAKSGPSKANRNVHGHWDDWPDAIRESLAHARRLPNGAELILHPVPGKSVSRTVRFPMLAAGTARDCQLQTKMPET